ncbi:alpha/beta hydrolase [Tundrisphaera sp. TA3]|uniref:alpha/beta hydrolase n=1 Tax=Tundrisphaera sp. TA3 TaxID=3435775 RepID=UPI003EBAB612
MRGRRERRFRAGAASVVMAALVVGAVVAQDPPAAPPQPLPNARAAPPAANPKGRTAKKGGLRVPGGNRLKAARKAGDPLAGPAADANNPNAAGQPAALGTFRYRFKLAVADNEPLAAAYYPSPLTNTAPAVLLIHERDRSSKDFEETIVELKGLTLAEDLQKQGYAVLAIDLRGHGDNPRKAQARIDWPSAIDDLNAAYACLVDRHNRGELNLAKLGVVAVGEGANLAAAWAANGGGVSSEGRTSDLGALVLVSPMVDAQAQGLPAASPISRMAARVPMDILYGERDAASAGMVASVANVVKRVRANKVESFPSALHGYKLLRLEPGLPAAIAKFLEGTVKGKNDEWEGRYLLTPVTYSEVRTIPNPNRADAAARKAAGPLIPIPPPPAPAPAPAPAMPKAQPR